MDDYPVKKLLMALTQTIPIWQALVGLLGVMDHLITFQINRA
jgi:hypothetical protein